MHADPFRALGLTRSSNADDVRRARRRLARTYHPDVASAAQEPLGRFQEIESAARAIAGEEEVIVEPIASEWWRFVGFSLPDPLRHVDLAVVGFTFQIHDLTHVPGIAHDTVRIVYADQVVPLQVHYSGELVLGSDG